MDDSRLSIRARKRLARTEARVVSPHSTLLCFTFRGLIPGWYFGIGLQESSASRAAGGAPLWSPACSGR